MYGKDGRYAYLMSELSGKVTVFRYTEGRLERLQEIVSDSVGARGGADIHLSPDGLFLYSSNRLKAEGIAIYAATHPYRAVKANRLSAYSSPPSPVQHYARGVGNTCSVAAATVIRFRCSGVSPAVAAKAFG